MVSVVVNGAQRLYKFAHTLLHSASATMSILPHSRLSPANSPFHILTISLCQCSFGLQYFLSLGQPVPSPHCTPLTSVTRSSCYTVGIFLGIFLSQTMCFKFSVSAHATDSYKINEHLKSSVHLNF